MFKPVTRHWHPSAPCSQWLRETRDAHLGAIPPFLCRAQCTPWSASLPRWLPRFILWSRQFPAHKAHRRLRGSSIHQSSASSRLGPQHRRTATHLIEPSVGLTRARLRLMPHVARRLHHGQALLVQPPQASATVLRPRLAITCLEPGSIVATHTCCLYEYGHLATSTFDLEDSATAGNGRDRNPM